MGVRIVPALDGDAVGVEASPAAERQRRLRHRRKLGLLVATAEVPLQLAERLVEAGLLPEDHSTDPERLGAALVAVCNQMLVK